MMLASRCSLILRRELPRLPLRDRRLGMRRWLDAFRLPADVVSGRSLDSQDDNRPCRCTKSARAITSKGGKIGTESK
jgi:hypothetical protein